MRKSQGLWFLLLAGLLALPLGMLWAESGDVYAKTAQSCDNCLWIPLVPHTNGNAPRVEPPVDSGDPQPQGPTSEPTATPAATPTATPTATPMATVPQPIATDSRAATPVPATTQVAPLLPTATKPVDTVAPPTPAAISTNVPGQFEIWELGTLVVVDEGTTIEMPADSASGFPGGTYVSGYTLEGQASSLYGSLVESGTFRLTLNLFRPHADYLMQKGGTYYLQGSWALVQGIAATAQLTPRELMRMRHDPAVLRGRLQTELRFNPLEATEPWSAKFALPMSTAAGTWARGEGTFTVDVSGRAYVSLALNVWKAAQ